MVQKDLALSLQNFAWQSGRKRYLPGCSKKRIRYFEEPRIIFIARMVLVEALGAFRIKQQFHRQLGSGCSR